KEDKRRPFAWLETVKRKRNEEMNSTGATCKSEEEAAISHEGGDQSRKKITIVFPEEPNLLGEEKWFTLRKAKRKSG
ncbi:hypothetical protein, partial [Brevibacillus sp. 179-C9.3 HS]